MSSPHPHPAAYDERTLLVECDVTRTRRSGPGGQHRNKVETAVVLRHRPTGLTAEAGERRSQQQNHRIALFRLRLKLAVAHRVSLGPDAPPSPLWQSRLRGGRISINPNHEDFPALLAEAMDAIASLDMDVKQAADRLGCSTNQLIKLLKNAPPALQWLNDHRQRQGQRPLR